MKSPLDADMSTTGPPKEFLIDFGLRAFTMCTAVGVPPDEVTAADVVNNRDEIHEFLISTGHGEAAALLDMMIPPGDRTPSEALITYAGSAYWAACGFPQIEMGHKFAAALLVSEVTKEALESLRMPWGAFLIEVPDGLLFLHDSQQNKPVSLRRILVADMPNGHGNWAYVAFTSSAVSIWRFGATAPELLPPMEVAVQDSAFPDHSTVEVTDEDQMVSALIGRLIINTCLAISMPDMTKEAGSGHATWARTKDPGRMRGDVRRFRIGKPVAIDLREHVNRYIRRERGKVEVRSLVRGHFKRQHYGAGNALVKVIWREPFWRGPEGADVLIRPHVIKAE
jgi:hypothetical protein